MKNMMKLLGIIAVAAIIGFSMAACDSGGDSGLGPADSIADFQGTWTNSNANYSFSGNSFLYQDNRGVSRPGTFTFTSNQITFIAPPGTWTGYTLNYRISETTLVLTGRSGPEEGTFTKQ